jgi:hypothetical protein
MAFVLRAVKLSHPCGLMEIRTGDFKIALIESWVLVTGISLLSPCTISGHFEWKFWWTNWHFCKSTTKNFGFLLPVLPITALFSHVHNHRDKTAPSGATIPQSLDPLRGCRVGSDQNKDINIARNRAHLYQVITESQHLVLQWWALWGP